MDLLPRLRVAVVVAVAKELRCWWWESRGDKGGWRRSAKLSVRAGAGWVRRSQRQLLGGYGQKQPGVSGLQACGLLCGWPGAVLVLPFRGPMDVLAPALLLPFAVCCEQKRMKLLVSFPGERGRQCNGAGG